MHEVVHCKTCGNKVEIDSDRIHAWGYVGLDILLMLPLVGIIVTLVLALGGTENLNIRSYARGKLCKILLFFVIFTTLFAYGWVTGRLQELASAIQEIISNIQ